ncbi:hypothetical protein BFW38_02375 [Terasakiispira papahanaumokuakeensis]|uniref:ApeA N-terminal domain-containing protein n=1 Tax=Terasakiispira papahanaumokuakeensis TaxID=197479 RepID=A0A1E2V6T3_9GAMM|nr:hypothetical protein [Terasakiispira papahanaumokuakeensis]ODC02562.1 hypothetical protein BFW38_02375 [Terasakiispira papahanaumokuakeensis]
MKDLSHRKETYSFDAEIKDSMGRRLSVDCKIMLPTIWGDKADIEVAVPHSVMPISGFENPCELNLSCSDPAFRVELSELWYRDLPTSVYPSRLHGAAPIKLTHISSMRVVRKCSQSMSLFNIYISSPDMLKNVGSWKPSEEMLEELAVIRCPKLGPIRLKRYWASAGLKGTKGLLSRTGFLLEATPSNGKLDPQEILEGIDSVLKLMSVFFRQKIMVLGWEAFHEEAHDRFWQYPLEPSRTNYVSVEPKRYLVNIHSLPKRMEDALTAYHNLDDQERKFVDALCYSLRPVTKIGESEWFMAMFRDLESIAVKSSTPKPLSEGETRAVDELRSVADSFKENCSNMSERINGFANKVERGVPPVTESICSLFQKYAVCSSDLWGVSGSKGLVGIRNKLAHGGPGRVHHQGLAVATLHLSLLNERLVHCILGLEISGDELHSGRDEWLQRGYIENVKKYLFDAAL